MMAAVHAADDATVLISLLKDWIGTDPPTRIMPLMGISALM
jgi:hypothetical protein